MKRFWNTLIKDPCLKFKVMLHIQKVTLHINIYVLFIFYYFSSSMQVYVKFRFLLLRYVWVLRVQFGLVSDAFKSYQCVSGREMKPYRLVNSANHEQTGQMWSALDRCGLHWSQIENQLPLAGYSLKETELWDILFNISLRDISDRWGWKAARSVSV